MRTVIFFWILIFISGRSTSQTSDTLLLTYEESLTLILENHPVAKQGDLMVQKGETSVLEARGGFDPKLSVDLTEKKFKDDPYYSLFNAQIDVPTKAGVKATAGYDRTSGVFLNPENFDPDGGLLYAGITIPLARGLLFDERRAQLQKAELVRQASYLERTQILNDLAYDASLAYWQWWLAYEKLMIFEDAILNALDQFQGVRQSALAGDRAIIDTVEANIQYQNLNLQKTQALLDYATATIYLSTFLWDREGNPRIIRESIIPSAPDPSKSLDLDVLLLSDTTNVVDVHPEIRGYDLKIKQLEVSRRLAKEYMKPTVNVKYNFLVDAGNSITGSLSTNNFNWGIAMQMPLLFRKERAKVQMAELTIADNEFARDVKRIQLQNKINAGITKWRAYLDQYFVYEQVVEDYQTMLAGERELFDNGESSQFLINSRQAKYIEANLKLKELYAGIRIAEAESYYSAGMLSRVN